MTGKFLLASEIGELETELFESESKLEQAKVALDVSGRSFKRGMLGIFLGVIFLLLAWPVGALMIVVGALAVFSAFVKRSDANLHSRMADAAIEQIRSKLAEKRASHESQIKF